jgi:hypothetical protein
MGDGHGLGGSGVTQPVRKEAIEENLGGLLPGVEATSMFRSNSGIPSASRNRGLAALPSSPSCSVNTVSHPIHLQKKSTHGWCVLIRKAMWTHLLRAPGSFLSRPLKPLPLSLRRLHSSTRSFEFSQAVYSGTVFTILLDMQERQLVCRDTRCIPHRREPRKGRVLGR